MKAENNEESLLFVFFSLVFYRELPKRETFTEAVSRSGSIMSKTGNH